MTLRTVIPKNDIVLSNGMYLKRGQKVEILLDEKEFSLIAPDIWVKRDPIEQKEPIKKKMKKAKNELD